MEYPEANDQEKHEVHDFIKTHPMAVLSTVSDNNTPWGAAIYCVADEEFNIFFVTREKTQKFKNIDANKKVALTFANSDTQQTLQIGGTISKVPSHDIVDVVFKKLASVKPKHAVNWSPPVIKVHQGDWMVLQITPDYAQYANYGEQQTDIDESYIKRLV